jgi:hypothetical protein
MPGRCGHEPARLRVVTPFTLRGYDWTDRYPANRRCRAQSTRRAKDPTGSAGSFGVWKPPPIEETGPGSTRAGPSLWRHFFDCDSELKGDPRDVVPDGA